MLDASDEGVAEKLASIDGIETVTETEQKAGCTTWRLQCASDTAPVPAVLNAARAAGWTVHGVVRETPSLETVFRDLMAQHARRKHQEDGQ